MTAPAPTARAAPAEQRDCPACGSEVGAYQEYCLRCGTRLVRPPGTRAAVAGWRRDRAWYAADWVWPTVGALVVAVTVATAAVAARRADDGATDAAVVATAPQATAPAADLVGPGEPPATSAGGRAPQPPAGTPASPPPPAAAPTRGGLVEWPATRDGWTVVVASLPKLAGREAAVGRAKAAADAGLGTIGILDTGSFSSFHPGYFVVFSGVYGNQAAAERASATARDKGYRDAYPREVTH